jgi:hypothetical protein
MVFLDPARPLHEMAEGPLDADDQDDEQADGEAHAFEQHRAECRRKQLFEGLTCGGEHDVVSNSGGRNIVAASRDTSARAKLGEQERDG